MALDFRSYLLPVTSVGALIYTKLCLQTALVAACCFISIRLCFSSEG